MLGNTAMTSSPSMQHEHTGTMEDIFSIGYPSIRMSAFYQSAMVWFYGLPFLKIWVEWMKKLWSQFVVGVQDVCFFQVMILVMILSDQSVICRVFTI